MQQYIPAKVLKAFIPDLQEETDSVQIKRIGNGLINHSYQISYRQLPDFFLQEINTTVFENPEWLQENYMEIKLLRD